MLHPEGIAAPSNIQDAELNEFLRATNIKLRVVGCGGAGKNTLNTLRTIGLKGVELVAMNTDAQDLLKTNSDYKVLLGRELTRGLGAGNNPDIGAKSAAESIMEVKKSVEGCDVLFITGGLGGGTGTGSIPIVAREAKKMGILTIAVVSLPFLMEGQRRWDNAMKGLSNLEHSVDSLVLIPNQKLMNHHEDLPLTEAFRTADFVLANAIKGIVEMITAPGLVNLDLADLQTVLRDSGVAMIGTGESDTEHRARDAIEMALQNPLLDCDLNEANGVLVNIIGGEDFSLGEAEHVILKVNEVVSEDAKILWGAQVEPSMGKKVSVLVVVTGLRSRAVVDSHADAAGFVEIDELA
jgi:cell division protein FtsZ